MVQAIISISKEANQVLNIVKAKYNLKDKSQAIEKVIEEYEDEVLEPELRPEYIERLKHIEKSPAVKVDKVEDLFK